MPFAGPVVAAVVCLPVDRIQNGVSRKLQGLNDSKQLTEVEREKFYKFLTTHPDVSFAVSRIEVGLIDSINILQASLRAMNKAMLQLNPLPITCWWMDRTFFQLRIRRQQSLMVTQKAIPSQPRVF